MIQRDPKRYQVTPSDALLVGRFLERIENIMARPPVQVKRLPTVDDLVYEVLRQGQMTSEEIKERLPKQHVNTIRDSLRKLEKTGKVRRVERLSTRLVIWERVPSEEDDE